jgi:hypothetical protein
MNANLPLPERTHAVIKKDHLAIAALAAIGGITYLNSAKSVGLSCETTNKLVAYSSSKDSSPLKEEAHVTTILQLSGSTWRYISWDGHPFQQMAEESSKSQGKPFHASDLDQPLKTTAEAYTLFDINQEKVEPGADGEYKTHRSGVIDRLTGAINMSESTLQQSTGFSWNTTYVGKCTPITIQANL